MIEFCLLLMTISIFKGRRIFLLLSLFFPTSACEEVVKLRQFEFGPKQLSQALGISNSICSRVQFHSLSAWSWNCKFVEVRFSTHAVEGLLCKMVGSESFSSHWAKNSCSADQWSCFNLLGELGPVPPSAPLSNFAFSVLISVRTLGTRS